MKTENIDIEDAYGFLVVRIKPKDVNKFLEFSNLLRTQKRSRLKEVIRELKASSSRKYNPKNASKKGFNISKTEGKICSDFKGTIHLYDHPKSIVRFPLTGSRAKDRVKAFELMGITDPAQIRAIRKKYVWHHLDDLDENLNCTQQLILKDAHKATFPHIGGPKLFEVLIGVEAYL